MARPGPRGVAAVWGVSPLSWTLFEATERLMRLKEVKHDNTEASQREFRAMLVPEGVFREAPDPTRKQSQSEAQGEAPEYRKNKGTRVR